MLLPDLTALDGADALLQQAETLLDIVEGSQADAPGLERPEDLGLHFAHLRYENILHPNHIGLKASDIALYASPKLGDTSV